MSKNSFFVCRQAKFATTIWSLLFCIVFSGTQAHGQTMSAKQREQIQAIVQTKMKSDHLAGVAVCVVEKGKTTFCQAFGYAEMEGKRPLTTDTPFQLASLSKQFAATSVMLLVGDGKLGLDDPIGDYLVSIPDEWKWITVRQLLAHTSGIKDYAKFPNIRADYQKDPKRDEMLARIYGFPLDFEPGSRFSYSNSGYTIVGCLIEKVSGMGYGKFLKQRIFDPLGMKTARLEPAQNNNPLRAIGHDYRNNEFHPSSYNSPVWAFAAGGIVASINDLAKWDAGIDSNALLTADQQKVLWTPQMAGGIPTDYGLGWMLRPAPVDKHFVIHPGGKPGFSATIARLVEDRLTIAVLSNRTEGQSRQILEEIGRMLLSIKPK